MADRILTCGVELELELRPKPIVYSQHRDILDRLGDERELILAAIIQKDLLINESKLQCLGIASPEYSAAMADGSIHENWKVMAEMGISPLGGVDNWIVELCSPVLYPNSRSPDRNAWDEEISMVWDTVTRYFEVIPNRSCGTHVHVKQYEETAQPSQYPAPYHFQDLQAVVKRIVLWEEAIASCIPAFRRFNANAVSNTRSIPRRTEAMRDYQRLGTGPGGYTFGTLFDKIDGLATTDLLCQYIGGSHGQSNLRLKYLAWNFAHIAQGNINTIEFRRPPMVSTLLEILHWVTLAASFVASAPRFTFSEGVRQQTVAPQLARLRPSYLIHGIDQVVNGRELLDIERFAREASSTGGNI